jgi:hypothetical protein
MHAGRTYRSGGESGSSYTSAVSLASSSHSSSSSVSPRHNGFDLSSPQLRQADGRGGWVDVSLDGALLMNDCRVDVEAMDGRRDGGVDERRNGDVDGRRERGVDERCDGGVDGELEGKRDEGVDGSEGHDCVVRQSQVLSASDLGKGRRRNGEVDGSLAGRQE